MSNTFFDEDWFKLECINKNFTSSRVSKFPDKQISKSKNKSYNPWIFINKIDWRHDYSCTIYKIIFCVAYIGLLGHISVQKITNLPLAAIFLSNLLQMVWVGLYGGPSLYLSKSVFWVTKVKKQHGLNIILGLWNGKKCPFS